MSPPHISGRAFDDGPFRSVPAQFEDRVDAHPDRPAVSYDKRTITYRDLDELANGLAASLRARGVGKGDVLPVLMVNSLELAVSYIALMKLGAVFVPLDPAWPADRIRIAIAALPGPIVLDREIVDIDRIRRSGRRPGVELGPDDLMYGIFTSGTTGTPKCAMNRHRGLVNRFRFMTRWFAATGTEVVLQNSKHTFDSSLWQLLWPLTVGGHVVLPVQGEFLDLLRTIDTIEDHGVTAADFVSSIFNALVATVDGEPNLLRKLASLRWLIVGSEPVNPAAIRRMRDLLPQLEITNGYGPTECSIGMAFQRMAEVEGDVVPLGRPIDNCYVVVLDDDRRPLPPGRTGELAVGGACVGAGYLDDRQTTERAFVPNPFPEHIPGDRIYLTGDLGHLDEQGRLYFSGRKDFQVKIGGMRIELGEIQVAAERVPGVLQAEVLVADQGGRTSLALFAAGSGIEENGLREHLRAVLPRTSVPRHYFLLPEIPLSDNGKADRQALQDVLDARLDSDTAQLGGDGAPAILRVLRQVLGDPRLTPDSDFFDAGGDSLQALTVVRTLRDDHDVWVGVRDLFDHPSARTLALHLDAGQAAEDEAGLMERDAVPAAGEPIVTAPLDGPLETLLVTGATGFVGARLVHELLTATGLRVRCLVRADSDAAATARVIRTLQDRALWHPSYESRIEGYAGDLGSPRLGLSEATWLRLARTCDLILHSGALVNFLFDYRAHQPVNVHGTAEVLRLAMAERPVPLHHIGTCAGLLGAGEFPVPETIDPTRVGAPDGGYNRSKWVAERWLAVAKARGALVTVLRLGEVMPAQDDGVPNPLALTHLLLGAFHRLGVRPDVPIMSDYTPVDYAAARIVAAVRDRGVWGSALHVVHPQSVQFGEVLPGIKPVPVAEFLRRLRDDPEPSALAALLPADTTEAHFADLLTDNAALFTRRACRALETRWNLPDEPLAGSFAAYRAYLDQEVH